MELANLPLRNREKTRCEALCCLPVVGVDRRLRQGASLVISADRIRLLGEYHGGTERVKVLSELTEEACGMDEREQSSKQTHAQDDPFHSSLYRK